MMCPFWVSVCWLANVSWAIRFWFIFKAGVLYTSKSAHVYGVFCSCLWLLPNIHTYSLLHVRPSPVSVWPSLQAHLKDPGVLMQMCSQSWSPVAHRSDTTATMNVTHTHTHRVGEGRVSEERITLCESGNSRKSMRFNNPLHLKRTANL